MRFIYAYSVWKHDCGPYSRRVGEFTDVDAIHATDQKAAHQAAVAAVRGRYPQSEGYYCSIPALKPLPEPVLTPVEALENYL